MNRENIEATVKKFPETMIAGWQEKHPEVGAPLFRLRDRCLHAERRLPILQGLSGLAALMGIFMTAGAASYFGFLSQTPTHTPHVFAGIACLLLGFILTSLMLYWMLGKRDKYYKVVSAYENALAKFEEDA